MFRNSISWYIFTFSLFELIIKTHLTLHDSSHGFISKNPRYFDDDLSNIHEEITSLRTSHMNDVSSKVQLKFEPSFLDFKHRPLGVPHLKKVTLFNTDKNKSIDMTSISGSTVHFHSSFFEDKRIPPNGNTSFNVVFLGREEGSVESNLFIHTSEGYLKYNVRGASTFSHYRLRPIVGIKLPLNSSFSPLIYLHNPHSRPIQIVEIYSSGGDFHLELPTGEQEGPNDMWKIPPQQTKAVIRVRFQAKVVQNHTAYVRIKLNKPDDILVVPLEVEVTSEMEIFHPQGFVDFGIGGNLNTPEEVKLCLYNPSKKHVRIHSVSTTSKAIKVQYYNIRLQPESQAEDKNNNCIDVGTLTLDWQTAYEAKDYTGKIIVKYRNGKNRSEIPYHLTVLKGGISYDSLTTTYFINSRAVDLSLRAFKVKNEFDYYLKISNITFPQDVHLYFKIEKLFPKVLKPKSEAIIFNIKLKNNIKLSDLQLHSHIILKTNISNIMVPLLSYNGKLQIHLPFKSKDYSLDIGLISIDSKKEVYFMIVNVNPVSLLLSKIQASIPMTQVELLGCGTGEYKLVLFQGAFSNITKCPNLNLKPNHYAIIKVVVTTTRVEGQVWGDIYIETSFEKLNIPVHFKVAPGKLEIGPDRLVFDQCFPAKICSHPLRVHSTYNDPMIIQDIITLPPDRRISSRHTGHILGRTSKVIGHLFLNPDLECQANCYTGLQTGTSAQWLKTFTLSKFVSDFDLHLVNIFYNRYLNLTSNGSKKWQNITLRLDTTEVRGHIFKTRVKMSWPSLLAEQNIENRSLFAFPLTQIGNYTYQNITIRNPASYNIVVQLVLDRDYPNVEVLYGGLPSNLIYTTMEDSTLSHGFFFCNETKEQHLDFFLDMLDIEANRNTFPILLLPGQSQTVVIGFNTQDTDVHSALLLLRNNLTILEVVRLKAQGGLPSFKFGNRRPGSLQPLLFDMTDKHLRDCERQKQYSSTQPNLTVKRTFTARNIGDVTVYINSFHINDFLCEGYGFKVIDCEPFILPPNGTRKIDIAFTPDLTLTKITRTLILSTSLNIPVNYTLYTTIPAAYLNLCADLIMRPIWEMHLNYLAKTIMMLLLIIIIFIALIDAERIKRQVVASFMSPCNPSVQPILDLRLVGQQTREEIQCTKPEVIVEEPLKDEKEVVYEESPLPNEEIVEEVKPKVEAERYTVLIPTTGKTKKKLGKRNSNEPNPEGIDIPVQEKVDKKKEKFCEIKHKIREKREEKELSRIEEKDKKHVQKDKEAKKSLFCNKKHTKNTNVPVYEEETSSTTTDSSCSNNEDPEKENNQRNTKVCSKVKLGNVKTETMKTPIEENPNHLPEVKHINFNHNNHNKMKHQKSATKTNKTNDKQNKDYDFHHKINDHHGHSKHHSNLRDGKKREKTVKDRKEKNMYHKKNADKHKHGERQSKISDSEGVEKRKSPSSFFIPLPTPPTTSSVWGESRAKFSDVVARNETTVGTSSSSNRPLAHTSKSTSKKPTMYVEPYKQTSPAELGPIGSRRTDYRPTNDSNRRSLNEDNHRLLDENFRALNNTNSRSLNDINHHPPEENNYLHNAGLIHEASSSFFTNTDELRLDNTNREGNYLEEFASISGAWNHQQNLGNIIEANISENPLNSNNSMEDPWNQSLLNSSSYWNSYNPLLNDTPPMNNTPLLNETSLAQTGASNSAGYLWGSSSVWQPWAPEAPRTPTRTPPGFDEFLQRKRDEQPQPPRESYSPFNTTTIWTQEQANPWKYSQEE